MNREIKSGQIYKHFKGHIYKIICVAKNSETLDEEVIYENIETNEIWSRPKSMFNSLVDKDKYPDVEQTYRFEQVKN